MNNYEYIISSLPAISLDWKFGEGASFETYVDWIKSQLSEADIKVVDRLLDGYKDENLTREFYEAALKDSNKFYALNRLLYLVNLSVKCVFY